MLAFVRTPRGVVKVGQALPLAIIAAVLNILTSVFSLLLLGSSSTYNYMMSGFVALIPSHLLG